MYIFFLLFLYPDLEHPKMEMQDVLLLPVITLQYLVCSMQTRVEFVNLQLPVINPCVSFVKRIVPTISSLKKTHHGQRTIVVIIIVYRIYDTYVAHTSTASSLSSKMKGKCCTSGKRDTSNECCWPLLLSRESA
jgi:hypothetical protein